MPLLNICSLFVVRRMLGIDAVEQIISAKISGKLMQQINNALENMKAARNDLYSSIAQGQKFHSIFFSFLTIAIRKIWVLCYEDIICGVGMLAMDSNRYDGVLQEHRKIIEALRAA